MHAIHDWFDLYAAGFPRKAENGIKAAVEGSKTSSDVNILQDGICWLFPQQILGLKITHSNYPVLLLWCPFAKFQYRFKSFSRRRSGHTIWNIYLKFTVLFRIAPTQLKIVIKLPHNLNKFSTYAKFQVTT